MSKWIDLFESYTLYILLNNKRIMKTPNACCMLYAQIVDFIADMKSEMFSTNLNIKWNLELECIGFFVGRHPTIVIVWMKFIVYVYDCLHSSHYSVSKIYFSFRHFFCSLFVVYSFCFVGSSLVLIRTPYSIHRTIALYCIVLYLFVKCVNNDLLWTMH